MDLTPLDLERLSAVITERSGMAFTEARWPFLQNRARAVMTRTGFRSARCWMAELEASSEARGGLYSEFEEALQVHETNFFRYERHHRILGDVVLPALLGEPRPRGGARVRIASLGCATGEEPYSIAMTVSERVPPGAADDVEIVAVDASREALAAAVRATYPPARVASVPEAYRVKYFVRGPEGFALRPAIRRMVRFVHHDIRRGFAGDRFQAIFCCNVLLYFTPAVKRQILGRLTESLSEGGYLFLGHAEGIVPPPSLFDSRGVPAGFVYRRSAKRGDLVPARSVRHA